jgi:hypothetical protein
VRAILDHRPQIARSRIVAIRQHDFVRLIGQTPQAFGTSPIGQLDMVDLPGRKIVTGMQPPRRAIRPGLADRSRIKRPQSIAGPAPARHPRLLAKQDRHDIAEPGRSLAQPLDQRRIAQAGEPGHFGPSTRFPQRHAAAAICQCQPQQRCRILDLPRPRESKSKSAGKCACTSGQPSKMSGRITIPILNHIGVLGVYTLT